MLICMIVEFVIQTIRTYVDLIKPNLQLTLMTTLETCFFEEEKNFTLRTNDSINKFAKTRLKSIQDEKISILKPMNDTYALTTSLLFYFLCFLPQDGPQSKWNDTEIRK